jgi:predicted nucleotidyltransferase
VTPIPGLDEELLRGIVRGGPTPLFATVSGAHLYGFPSPDSDVDLRGAFVAPLKQVVGICKWAETLTVSRLQGGIELDWVAHDVAKFALLMTRRNGYVLEQLYSPLVVYGGSWHDELKSLGAGGVVRQLFFHYRGFLQTQRKALTTGKATVKALLYAYRVVLTGVHVLRSGRILADLPTLATETQVAGVSPDAIAELIERKVQGSEKGALSKAEHQTLPATLDTLEAALAEAYEGTDLPVAFEGLDALNDFVVRARLELGVDGDDSL